MYLWTSSVLCLAAVLSSSWWRGTIVSSSVLTSLLGGGAMVRLVVTVVRLVVVKTWRGQCAGQTAAGPVSPSQQWVSSCPAREKAATLCRLGLCKLANVATTTLSLLHNVWGGVGIILAQHK